MLPVISAAACATVAATSSRKQLGRGLGTVESSWPLTPLSLGSISGRCAMARHAKYSVFDSYFQRP